MKWCSFTTALTIALAVGGGFGAATSLINDISSPYGMIGGQIAETGWAWTLGVVEVVSRLVGLGWAWGAFAIIMGYFAGSSILRSAAVAIFSLLAATTAYYGMDSILREEPFGGYFGEMIFFWLVSLVSGPAFGAVGAGIRHPGVIGLLCGLAVPVGASAWVIWEASGILCVSPAMHWARAIVWVGSAVVAGIFIARFISRWRLDS